MNRTFLAFVLAAIAALVITAADRPVGTGPRSLVAARQYLEGHWRLMSFEVIPPGKDSIRVPGAGNLTYDQFGNLELEIRVDAATAILLEAAGVDTDKGVLSNRGRTKLDLRNRTLTYILEGELPLGAPTGPLALNRPRYWKVEHILTLVTNNDEGQAVSIGRWQKAP